MNNTNKIVTRLFPIKETKIFENNSEIKVKRKVCGYARVSTEKDDQFTSYEAQIKYYTDFIKSNKEWEFVKVYTDEGITGTCVRLRPGFNEMIRDALNGKIDLIVTKSISRFARNTVDSLITIRKLKEVGCECFFEKENIYTMDSKGEFLITIMSSIAQEESRSISENVTWGIRKRLADGQYYFKYSEFLGYMEGPNKMPIINEAEACIVKRIYLMALEGLSTYKIATILNEDKIKTPTGKNTWYSSVVRSILTNERYTGDAILQKTYSVDFLTKKRKKNNGEIPKYYVKNGHPAIISKKMFLDVQKVLEKDNHIRFTKSDNIYSKRIKCEVCGNWYCKTVWHSNNKAKVLYRCNKKYYNNNCNTPFLLISDIEEMYKKAIDFLIENKELLFKEVKHLIEQKQKIKYLEEEQEEISKYETLVNKRSKRIKEINRIINKNNVIINLMNDYITNNDYNKFIKQLKNHNLLNDCIDYFVIFNKNRMDVFYYKNSKKFSL